jgi:integral membrane protein
MSRPIHQLQVPAIHSALKLYKVSSFITGIFLLLLMATWALRRLENVSFGALIGYDLWIAGPNGLLTAEPYLNEGEGMPETGLSLTVAILVVHGWLYVLYLFADFRVWTLMRWSFLRFLIIAAGGVVPFLSFYTEKYYGQLAEKEIADALSGAKN